MVKYLDSINFWDEEKCLPLDKLTREHLMLQFRCAIEIEKRINQMETRLLTITEVSKKSSDFQD